MINNKYLVIKLPGNWIQREQCKQYYKHSVYGADLEFVDDETIRAGSFIPYFLISSEDFKNRAKKNIARYIGEQLLEKGMLVFTEPEEHSVCGEKGIMIKAQITVINDRTPIGAYMRGEEDEPSNKSS